MSVEGLRVREAERGDADGIAAVHVESWRETYAGVIPDRFWGAEAVVERRRMWHAILELEPVPGAVAVAERDGRIVGFAFAGSTDHPDASKGFGPARELHLFSIYLLAAEQGVGTGRALLDAVLGDRPAQLWVLRTNLSARDFYTRHGFHEDGVEFNDPDLDGIFEVRMVR